MKRLASLLSLTLASVTACSDPAGPAAAALWIVADADTIAIGSTLTLGIAATDAAGTPLHGVRAYWSSSNAAVASVDPDSGEVVGVAPGAVMITASAGGRTAYREVTVVPAGVYFADVAGAWVHSCALAVEGRIYCAGWQRYGMLGNGQGQAGASAAASRLGLVATVSDTRFRSVSAFGLHACALTRGGEVHCWGPAFRGELGVTEHDFCEIEPSVVTGCRVVPARIAGDQLYRAVATAVQASCALRIDGRAFCWGDNSAGALGTASVGTWGLPVPVDGDLVFETIGGGRAHFCATTPDSRAFCWGSNYYGQLGTDGVPTCLEQEAACAAFRPLPVLGGRAFTTVAAGGIHSCGITTARELYCWGNNTFGQLGDGSTVGSLAPRRVEIEAVMTVSLGEFHSCAIVADGRAFCWGLNDDGQVGALSTATCMDATEPYPCSTTPNEVEGGHRWAKINLGRFHSCGVTNVQEPRCWGWNQYGQLGNGTFVGGTPPTRMRLEGGGALAPQVLPAPDAERYAIPALPREPR